MTDACRDLLDQVEPKDLTQIALQMLGTIESMELIIPEITDTIRKALEQCHPTPQSEPEVLTDEELDALEQQCYAPVEVYHGRFGEFALDSRRYARAVIAADRARWGRP